MNGSTGTSPALISRTFPQCLGIFIDVQNMFYSAKLLHQSKVDILHIGKERKKKGTPASETVFVGASTPKDGKEK